MKQTHGFTVIKLLLLMVLFLTGASSAEAVYRDAGAASWPFLKMDIGARAAALGGTGLLNSGALAIFANPALLAFQEASVTASHNSWYGKTDQQVLSAVFRRGDRLGASLAFRVLNTSGLEYRETPSSEPLGTFDVTDLSLNAAVGLRIGGSFAVGAGVKFIREKVWIEESSGFCFDIGLLSTPARGLVLSAAVQNIGPGAVMASREYRLPRTIRAAAGYTVPSPVGSLTVSTEIQKPIDNSPRGGAGLEYQPLSWVALRGGYRFNDPSSTITTGMGFSQRGWVLDYAYVPGTHSLGDTHRFTLTRAL
ncbi:MAG: PorV/PorQ family protein [Candidatus Fermentibacteraceae bacterium]